MTLTAVEFRNITMLLNSGNYVETSALKKWVKDASSIYKHLISIPEYYLVATDLLRKVSMACSYLDARKAE